MSRPVCAIVNLFLTRMHGMVRANMSIVKSAVIPAVVSADNGITSCLLLCMLC